MLIICDRNEMYFIGEMQYDIDIYFIDDKLLPNQKV